MVNGVDDTRPGDLCALVGQVLSGVRRNETLIPRWLRAVSGDRISPWLVGRIQAGGFQLVSASLVPPCSGTAADRCRRV